MILASWTQWYFYFNFFVNWGRHLDFDSLGFQHSGGISVRMGISGMGISSMGISGMSIRVGISGISKGMGKGNGGSGSFISRPPFAGLSSNKAGDGGSERVNTSGGNYFGNEFFDFNGDFFDNMFVLHGLL